MKKHKPRKDSTEGGSHGGYQAKKVLDEYGELPLTEKQRKFIKHYLKYGNGVRAAMYAYDCSSYASAHTLSYHNLKVLRKPIKAYMEHHKFGLEDLFKTMKDGLKATKFEKTGAVKYEERPDHVVREKFLRHASRWLEVPAPPDAEEALDRAGIIVNVFEPSLKKGFKGRLKGKKVE